MKSPQTIVFSDIELSAYDVLETHCVQGLIPKSWTRVQFNMPTDWDKFEAVQTWLRENVANEWAIYDYYQDRSSDRTVVVKFKDKTDALMFKLRGGHQAWQEFGT